MARFVVRITLRLRDTPEYQESPGASAFVPYQPLAKLSVSVGPAFLSAAGEFDCDAPKECLSQIFRLRAAGGGFAQVAGVEPAQGTNPHIS